MHQKHYSEVFAFLAIVIVLFGLFRKRDKAQEKALSPEQQALRDALNKRGEELMAEAQASRETTAAKHRALRLQGRTVPGSRFHGGA